MKKYLLRQSVAALIVSCAFFLIRLLLERPFPFNPFDRPGNSAVRIIAELWIYFGVSYVYDFVSGGSAGGQGWGLTVGVAALEAIMVGCITLAVWRVLRHRKHMVALAAISVPCAWFLIRILLVTLFPFATKPAVIELPFCYAVAYAYRFIKGHDAVPVRWVLIVSVVALEAIVIGCITLAGWRILRRWKGRRIAKANVVVSRGTDSHDTPA